MLRCVGISEDLGQGTVVTDRSGKDEGNIIFDNAVHNTIVDLVICNKTEDGTAGSNLVDHA